MIQFSSDVDENSVNSAWKTMQFSIDNQCSDCVLKMFSIDAKSGQISLYAATPGHFPGGGAMNESK